jgi:hypothetical protein
MRDSMDSGEREQILKDIEYTKAAEQCNFVVNYYGAQFREVIAFKYFLGARV